MSSKINVILLLICLSSSVFSADALTEKQLDKQFNEVTSMAEASINDRGTYLVVTLPKTNEFVAFTKVSHPAHPGILRIRIFEENGELKFSSAGKWGENEKEFLKFQNETNQRFIEYFKNTQQVAPRDAANAAHP